MCAHATKITHEEVYMCTTNCGSKVFHPCSHALWYIHKSAAGRRDEHMYHGHAVALLKS